MKRKEKKKENKNKKQLVSSETTALLEAEHRRISTQLVATRNQLPTIPWRIPKYLRNNTLLRHKFCKVLNPSLSPSLPSKLEKRRIIDIHRPSLLPPLNVLFQKSHHLCFVSPARREGETIRDSTGKIRYVFDYTRAYAMYTRLIPA